MTDEQISQQINTAVNAMTSRIDELEQKVDSTDLKRKAELLLPEASEWARHYSTVRSTVATFLITLSLGIYTFGWEKQNSVFFYFAWAVWSLSLILFLAFSVPEWFALQHRREHLSVILGQAKSFSLFRIAAKDAGLWAMLILTAAFYIAPRY